MKTRNELLREMVKGLVEGLITAIVIVAVLALMYKFCYHIDGVSQRLGDNYAKIEERFTDFNGKTIIKWDRYIAKDPMEMVIYEKRF